MEITRKYTHKSFGEIGTVALTVPESGWSLDGQALNAEAVRHLATFALQSLQDAYAGAKDATGAADAFASKYDRIRDGSIGTREGGERNPVRARAIIIALRHVKVDTKGMEAAEAAKAKRAAALKAIERNPAFMSLAQSQIDAEAALGDAEVDEPESNEAEAA